jgi:hypothetical protein
VSIPAYKEAALKRLLEDPPKLHRPKDFNPADDQAAEDGLVSWGIQEFFLKVLTEMVTPDSLTLEIGSGLSTVCFAIIGSAHICVSPIQKEHNRIREYCSKHQISTERIRFIPMKSHAFLPSLDLEGRKLDFALIDGSHTFPEPIIDYYYVNEHLKVGGLLAIDDLPISSVGILHKFLITEPAYEQVRIDWWYGTGTGIYRKVGKTDYPHGWSDQRFNSRYPDLSYLPTHTRVRERLRPVEVKLRAGLGRVPGLRGAYHLLRAWVKKDPEYFATEKNKNRQ